MKATVLDKQIKFLLCVDPDSHQIYTLNLETQEIHIESVVPPEYRERAENDIAQIAKII